MATAGAPCCTGQMLDELVKKSPALVLVVVSWREDIVMQHSPLLALSCTANSGNIKV